MKLPSMPFGKLSLFNIGVVSRRRKWAIPTMVGLLTVLFFAWAHLVQPQAIMRMSNLVFDSFQKQYPREFNPDVPVRIIDIDDESIRRIGQWPWPRTVLAKLNTRLADAGAAVVAYDVLFSETDRTSPENMVSVLQNNPDAKSHFDEILTLRSHDEIFAESFQQTRVVNGLFLINRPTLTEPQSQAGFAMIGDSPVNSLPEFHGVLHAIPPLEATAEGAGSVSFQPDKSDGVVRTAPLISRIGDRIYPSLALEALRTVQGATTYQIRSSNASYEAQSVSSDNIEVKAIRVGDFEIPTTANGSLNVYFTQPPHPERYIPAWKILSDSPSDFGWKENIMGHIVFIGTGAEGLKDIVQTPFRGGEPGVLVHAQATEQILTGDYLYRPFYASSLEFYLIVILGIILTLTLPRLKAIRGGIVILLIGNGIFWGSNFAFKEFHYLLDPVYPLLAMLTCYVFVMLTSYYMAESERARVRGAFNLYLSPEMVQQVSENPALLKLGGQEQEISILFLDIRSFSRISESMRPQDITTFLNKFLTPMTNILQAHDATIDKYIGDAIVAFWNAPIAVPEHQKCAARAVLQMQLELAALNAKYRDQKEIRWPDTVSIGIGINTGICCVGNLGSEQRFSYSMIGDAANLASRIEGLTKQYRVASLFGSETANAVPDFAFLEADKVYVVGREAPETIYLLAGDDKLALTAEFKAYQKNHKIFLEQYRNQHWDEALQVLETLREQSAPYDLHKYYFAMEERIAQYKKSPPEKDWGGAYRSNEK